MDLKETNETAKVIYNAQYRSFIICIDFMMIQVTTGPICKNDKCVLHKTDLNLMLFSKTNSDTFEHVTELSNFDEEHIVCVYIDLRLIFPI